MLEKGIYHHRLLPIMFSFLFFMRAKTQEKSRKDYITSSMQIEKNDYFYAIKEHKASKMHFDAIVKTPNRWTMFCNRVSC